MGHFVPEPYRGRSLVREVFVETGTYLGESVQIALDAGFHEVYSVEVYQPNYEVAVKRFRDDPRVHLYLGSSPDFLREVIRPDRPTTFWLDAHFQGNPDEQDRRYGQCPVIHELRAIWSVRWEIQPYIIIDDARCFVARETAIIWQRGQMLEDEWPSYQQIIDGLPANYRTQVLDNKIYSLPET